jgi:hypothetical protein
LTELTQAGVRLRPAEAVAIVAEVCAQRRVGRLRGVPSANVVRLTDTGDVVAEGPVNTDGPAVACAAQLLDDLMPDFDAPPEYRAPGGLRLAIARGLGSLDVPPFESLDHFTDAIARFSAPDVRTVARELFAAWMNAQPAATDQTVAPAPAAVEALPDQTLTISDVRRARRATGLTLADVSERSRIPSWMLRELEWGYLRNWPGGLYGRSQLVRYARAAGLDEQLVVEIAWPLVDEVMQTRPGASIDVVHAEQSIDALVPLAAQTPQIVSESERNLIFHAAPTRAVEVDVTRKRSARRQWGLGALAAAATLTIALLPTAWQRVTQHAPPTEAEAQPAPIAAVPLRSAPVVADAQPATGGPDTAPDAAARPRQRVPDGALPAAPLPEQPAAVKAQPAAYSPTFSNAGTPVFFREEAGGTMGREEGEPRGTTLKITRIVDDNAHNFHARPSPDGSRIAFDSDREGMRAVYVADADGQHVRRISGDGFAAIPSWSPNGEHLVFVKSEANDPEVWNLWTTDLGTGELQRVTSYPSGQPRGASWFPDGQRIAFSHEDELVVLNLETKAQQVFKTPRGGHPIRTPAVSPDGRRVIFQVQRDGGWLLDLKNGSMRRVLEDPAAEEYTWSPDGHRVAFFSPRVGGWGVWLTGQ